MSGDLTVIETKEITAHYLVECCSLRIQHTLLCEVEPDGSRHFVISPDGTLAVATTRGGEVRLLDLANMEQLDIWHGHMTSAAKLRRSVQQKR